VKKTSQPLYITAYQNAATGFGLTAKAWVFFLILTDF